MMVGWIGCLVLLELVLICNYLFGSEPSTTDWSNNFILMADLAIIHYVISVFLIYLDIGVIMEMMDNENVTFRRNGQQIILPV